MRVNKGIKRKDSIPLSPTVVKVFDKKFSQVVKNPSTLFCLGFVFSEIKIQNCTQKFERIFKLCSNCLGKEFPPLLISHEYQKMFSKARKGLQSTTKILNTAESDSSKMR